jgi:hypothetical protein
MVRSDDDATYRPIEIINSTTGTLQGSVFFQQSTIIELKRFTGGLFDNTNYDSTGYNRGWLYVEYID